MSESDVLIISVNNKDLGQLMFKLKKSTKMRKVFKSYAERNMLDESDLQFFINGTPISETSTPQMMQLEDDAIIECSYLGNVSIKPICVLIKNNLGEAMRVTEIKRFYEMRMVFKVYTAKYYKSVDMSSLRFFFNDKLISETDLCQSLQLKEGDQIDCYTRSEIIVLELLRQCESGISFRVLLEKIVDLPRHIIRESSFVHRAIAIMSGKTPLEFMKHIISAFPDEVSKSTDLFCPHGTTQSYLLHLACYNEHCPTSIIKLLIEKYSDALRHFCVVRRGIKVYNYGKWNGLPLHYYLSREKNIDIDTVKMLAEVYPQAMLTAADDGSQSTPIHVVMSNPNIKNKCEIITHLLDSEPSSIRYIDDRGRTLLARACGISGVDSLVIQLLLDAWPEALMIGDERGWIPIHCICSNSGLDDSTSLNFLHLLINDDDDDATSLRIVDDYGFLPLHYAVFTQSTGFCKELIDLYPQSVWAETSAGDLPIHIAANVGRVDKVRYLLKVCPESIHAANNNGYLPVHKVARIPNISDTITPERYTEVLELLLGLDPSAASVPAVKQRLPLHLACAVYSEYLPVIQLLFDLHPRAIWAKDEDGNTPLDLARKRQGKKDSIDTTVIDFLEDQLKYVTEDMVLDGNEGTTTRSVFWSNLYKCTQDGSGSLPLHHSLQNNATLGVIKVLLYENPDTLRVANHQGLLPIHIACQYSSVRLSITCWTNRWRLYVHVTLIKSYRFICCVSLE